MSKVKVKTQRCWGTVAFHLERVGTKENKKAEGVEGRMMFLSIVFYGIQAFFRFQKVLEVFYAYLFHNSLSVKLIGNWGRRAKIVIFAL